MVTSKVPSCILKAGEVGETKMDEIDQIGEAEEANFQTAKTHLRDSVSLVQDLVDLYKLLAEMVKKSGVEPRDEIITAAQFLLACRYQLTLGALAALRGHLTDSFSFARKAIEFCAFAARVKKHPHLAMVWLRAADGEAAYEKYREKFSPGKLFPEDHVVLGELGDRYDQCSKRFHPSIYSVASHIKVERTSTDFNMTFDYFELKDTDPSEPVRTFLWIIDTHFGIVRVFEEVLADVVAHDRKKWEVRRNAVDGKIGVHKARWKAIIKP